MAKKLDDTERARIAQGWDASDLSQEQYAAQFGLTGRAIRKWRSRFVADRNPVEQVEVALQETIEVLQALLASVRALHGSAPERAERDARFHQLVRTPMAACSASFRSEPPEVGTAESERCISAIVGAARAASATAAPLVAIDRPEQQHPVDESGPHPLRQDLPQGTGQTEPPEVEPLPMPRPGGGFLTPY